MPPNDMAEGREVMTVESGTVALLNKSEIDQQIATAHKYPRSISSFRKEALQMVTLTENIAGECIYALPRREKDKATGQWINKTIEGPSARFAEVIASAWGNARAGARIVNEGAEFVTAQGVFHDLERNVAITYEVQRRITGSTGRFSADMIGVTANAACSIALRNAILKGIPKAFWSEMYQAARLASIGDVKSIANKRSDAVKAFVVYGINEAQILARLGRQGVQDITIDDLVLLAGFLTAIKDGDGSPESIFSEEAPATSPALDAINAKVKAEHETSKAPAETKTASEATKQPTSETNGAAPTFTFAEISANINAATNTDELNAAVDLIKHVPDPAHQKELRAAAKERAKAIAKG